MAGGGEVTARARRRRGACQTRPMPDFERTHLPGVGDRRDFVTQAGDRIGVIAHRHGHRELLIYDRDDPDSCRTTVRLSEEDWRRLTDLCDAS